MIEDYIGYVIGGFFGVMFGMYLTGLMIMGTLRDIHKELQRQTRTQLGRNR